MGVYLPKPKTEKITEDGGEFPLTTTRFGLSAMQGWRQYMEDAHIAHPLIEIKEFDTLGVFGVFDGHGGPAVSSWIAKEFQHILRSEILAVGADLRSAKIMAKKDFDFNVVVVCEALQRTFLRLDVEMKTAASRQALRKIHEDFERQKSRETNDEAPRSLLDALLASVSGKKPANQPFNNGEFDSIEEASEVKNGLYDDSGFSKSVSDGEESNESNDIALDPSPVDTSEIHPSEGGGHNGLQPHQPECCGSTAVVVAVVGNKKRHLITANAGDSRAVLCRGNRAIALSKDHKPSSRHENRRIVNAGGKVVNGRVDGNLNLSRALGDLFYKSDSSIPAESQKIISFPDVRVLPVEQSDQFIIIACDGIWDCLSNQEAVDFVLSELNALSATDSNSMKISQICERICDKCLCANPLNSEGGIGCDNMTVLIILLGETCLIGSSGSLETLAVNELPQFYGDEPEDELEYED